MSDIVNHFGEEAAATYDQRWAPLRPLQQSLHLQTSWILKDIPCDARVLCVGAGTGAEVLALADQFPNWRFVLVDPSAFMLNVAREKIRTANIESNCEFHVGYLHELPNEVVGFDAATAFLVSHFIISRDERVAFFHEIFNRLTPNGRLVTVDLSASSAAQQHTIINAWIEMMRYAGATEEQCTAMLETYGHEVSLLTSEEMVETLTSAGFSQSGQFAQQLMIRAHFAFKSSSDSI